MTPEKQAALIAEWLDKPPGTPPPEGVDPDAIETVFALSPERAPAPRVSIDDILAGVGSGPFFEAPAPRENKTAELPLAEAAPAPIAEQPEEPEEAQVIDLAARRRRRIWGGVGVAAMAALVLFSVAPEEGFENLADAPMPAEQAAPTTTAAPDAAPATEWERNADFAEQELQQPASKAAEEPQSAMQAKAEPPAPPQGDEAKDAPSSGRYDQLELSSGGASYGEPPADPAPAPEGLADLEDYAGNTADDVDRGTFADEDVLEEAEEELAQLGATSQSVSESSYRQAPSKQRTDRRTRGESAKKTGGSASSAPAVAEMDIQADDWDDTPAEVAPIPTDLAGLRAAAVPADYNSSWYLRSLSDEELDRFDKAIETGTEADLISDGDVFVGQDMAFRAAKRALAAGQTSDALSFARQGQRRSSSNSAFLSNLYYIEGRALESQGDTEGAKRAYTSAANLNRAR